MLRVRLTELSVDDQEKAKAFYTEKLGLVVETDAAYGPDSRWLTVVAPDDPSSIQILLNKADEQAAAMQQHLRNQGKPAMSFSTDDCQATYDTLRDRGVDFVSPPTTYDYGGTDAVFDDGCGNLINLHQE